MKYTTPNSAALSAKVIIDRGFGLSIVTFLDALYKSFTEMSVR